MKALLDEDAAAKLLGCSREMVRKLKRIGRLRFVKVGRLTRYSHEDLEAYVREASAIRTLNGVVEGSAGKRV